MLHPANTLLRSPVPTSWYWFKKKKYQRVFRKDPNGVWCQSLSCFVFYPSLPAFVFSSPVWFNSSPWCAALVFPLSSGEQCCETVEQWNSVCSRLLSLSLRVVFLSDGPPLLLLKFLCWTSFLTTIPPYLISNHKSVARPHLKSRRSQFSHSATSSWNMYNLPREQIYTSEKLDNICRDNETSVWNQSSARAVYSSTVPRSTAQCGWVSGNEKLMKLLANLGWWGRKRGREEERKSPKWRRKRQESFGKKLFS